jgi:amidohydrolase
MVQSNDLSDTLAQATDRLTPALIAFRRDLHAHPELAFQETRTAEAICRELTDLKIDFQRGVGTTGVVGTIAGGRPGRVLALRADMDALPIAERTGLPFASTEAGLMHACGHDIHSTILLGAAAVLAELAPQLAGEVRLIFQPAEEILEGAAAMLADGALDGVDMAIGFHNQPDLPVGVFSTAPGPIMASADRFEIVVHGRSGHAAFPSGAIDPIVAAASLVGQLQTVVSREMRATHPAVVTVGSIHGGTASNIIPDSCTLLGTVRTLHVEARELAEAAIHRLCLGLETSMRVRCDVSYKRNVPPLVNDAAMTGRVTAALRAQFGDVVRGRNPVMGAEDFALMAELVPACQFNIGSGQPGRADRLHNSDYQPDEACIGIGVQALSRVALELLS